MIYEIWMEGYAAIGEYSGATFHGKIEAESFKDACIKKFQGNKYFNSEKLTYWGCGLFDNVIDARKNFG